MKGNPHSGSCGGFLLASANVGLSFLTALYYNNSIEYNVTNGLEKLYEGCDFSGWFRYQNQ